MEVEEVEADWKYSAAILHNTDPDYLCCAGGDQDYVLSLYICEEVLS